MKRTAHLGWSLLLAAAGCHPSEAASTRAPAPSAAPSAAAEDHTGAMAPVTGDREVDRAITRAQQSARSNPTRARPLIDLAKAYIRKARETADPAVYELARDAVDRAMRLERDNIDGLQLQALLMMQDHRFREVREAIQRLIARNPNQSMSYGLLGDAELELGNYTAAEAAYQRMVNMRPNLASYSRAAWMRWLLGDVDGAIDLGRRAAEAGSPRAPEELAWTLVQLGGMYLATHDLEHALQQYDIALQVFPGHPPSHLGKGRVLEARGDLAGAVAQYRAAVQGSTLTEHLAALAEALAASGQPDEAARIVAQMERAGRRSDPRGLALYYANHDASHDDAVDLARRELANRPDEVFTQDVAAWALFRAGRLDEARALSTQSRRLGTPEARFLFHGGMIEAATGHRAEAIELLQGALQLNADFDRLGAAEARRTLTTLGADAGAAVAPRAAAAPSAAPSRRPGA